MMNKTFNKLTLLFTILVFCILNIYASTKHSEDKTIETFEVAEHQVFCEEIVPRKCLYIKRKGEKKHKALWDQIENFRYISGFQYVLKVEVETISNPPKDTSGYKYYLKEIVSREMVEPDTKANLYVSKWFLTHIKGMKIAGGKPFIVFEKEKETFYGNTSCNGMHGQLDIQNHKIKFSRIRQTKRACINMQTVESPFVSILSQENELDVEVDRLYLKQNGLVVLEFKSNWAE